MASWPYTRSTTGEARLPASMLASVLLTILACSSTGGVELSRASDTLLTKGPGPYQLGKRFIIEDSDSVLLGDVLLTRDEDYRINYRLGLLTLKRLPSESVAVVVSYRFFPFQIGEQYYRHKIQANVEGEKVIMKKEPVERKETSSAPSTLIIGGSKSLGISVGSGKDIELEQALRVNISGMAAEGVEVRAILSDQSTPIQPEGTTEELEELDQVVLEIKGKNLGASFGDYDLEMRDSRFGEIARKLEGGMGEVRFSGVSLMAAAARNRGSFGFNRLWGIDAKQGPYQLTSEDGRTDIVIVAGSEKVYVDGEIKKRGQNNDYVIDYSTAQVTFTSRVLITSLSRILVDFEYAVLDYRRSLYAASASYSSLAGKLLIGGSYLYEGDDKDSPVGLSITPERKELLQNAGDDTSLAWAPGGVWVGDSLGSYTLTDSVYEYKGYGKGDYSVSFTRVPEGEGDYEYNYALGGYEYVGLGNGDYVAKVRLPLPQRDEFYSFRADYEIAEGVAAGFEYAGNRRDENSFSSIEDDDNIGSAYDFSFDGNFREKLFMRSKYRVWDDRFSFPGRRTEVQYEDNWNVGESEGEESAGELEVGVSPFDGMRMTASFGRLKRPGGEANKTGLDVSFNHISLPSISYAYSRAENHLDTTGTRIRHGLTATQRLGRFSPRLSFFKEEGETRLREGTAGLSLGLDWMTGDVSYSHRLDDVLDEGGWTREGTIRTARASFRASRTKRVSGSLDFVHRDKRYEHDFPGESSNYDLASLRLKVKPIEKRMSVEARYELTQTQSRARREVFHEVEEGTGDYSKDPSTGEYYPDPEGNYRREIVATGDYRPVADISSSFRVYLLPVDVLSFDGFITIEEKTVQENRFSIYTFDFKNFHNDSTTLSGTFSFQGDIDLFPYSNRSLSMKLRYGDYEDNRLETVHQERERFQLSLLGKSKLSRALSGEVEVGTRSEETRSTERGSERRESWKNVRSTLTWRLNNRFEPSISAGYEMGEVSEPYHYGSLGAVAMTSREISPRIRYYLTRRGRAELIVTVTDRRSESDVLPPDIQTIYAPGLTTTVRSSTEYRVNEWLTSFLNYSVRKEPDDKRKHTFRAEMRASF